jgi:hypothetical protein
VRRSPIVSDFWPLNFYRNLELLSIAILTDLHHNSIKDDLKRVVMHFRVSINSYNVNAQVIISKYYCKVKS